MKILPLRSGARSRRLPAAILAVLALAAAGCSSDATVEAGGAGGSGDATTASADATTDEAAAEPSGPVLDPAVFDGEAVTVAGASYDLGQLADQDLVLWFWAPW